MFLGLTCTLVCATYAVNVFVLFWFTVTSDQSKVPIDWRDKFYRFGWDMNAASNAIGYLVQMCPERIIHQYCFLFYV